MDIHNQKRFSTHLFICSVPYLFLYLAEYNFDFVVCIGLEHTDGDFSFPFPRRGRETDFTIFSHDFF